MQVEFKAYAYKVSDWDRLEDMLKGESLPTIHIKPDLGGDKYTKEWARIGTARVIVDFDDQNTIVANQVTALKAALQAVRIENQQRENLILDQIGKLTALDYVPVSKPQPDDIPF